MALNKILITGGAGFIGSHLANTLNKKGHSILVIDNLSRGKKENLDKKIILEMLDIRSTKLPAIIRKYKPDYIFHLAAQSSIVTSLKKPHVEMKTNFLPTLTLLDEAKKIKLKKIIFASSAAVYGTLQKIPAPENHQKHPLSPYGISKLASEHYINYFCSSYNMPYAILRYSNVYGPKQDSSAEGGVIAIFINNILNNTPATIYGSGNQTRDFIYVDDVVRSNIKSIKIPYSGVLNIASSKEISINNLFKLISSKLKHSVPAKHSQRNVQEVNRSALQISRANKNLKWSPIVKLEDGLDYTIKYFKR